MQSTAIGLFRRAVMEHSAEGSGSESPAQAGAGGRSESFPFLTERLAPRQGEVPRQAALDRWRNAG